MNAFIHAAVAHPIGDALPTEVPGQDLLPKAMARRLNTPLRRAIGCALEALRQAGVERPDAIHFGTGLGCLTDTQEFLLEIDRNAGSTLPPTSFMRSTHNTVPGLLALALGVRGPNITHSQGLLSFHAALLHALLHLQDHPDHRVLVGAADEHLPVLDALRSTMPDVLPADAVLRDGTAWFVLGAAPGPVRITEVRMQDERTLPAAVPADLELTGIGWVSGASASPASEPYWPRTGAHQSAPAQALALALARMRAEPAIRRVRVLDRARSKVGLIHVERC